MDSESIRSLYGQLTGMAGPLINLPQVITQAIAISLVPTVVTAYKTQDQEFLQHNIVLSIRTTLIVALPCTVGLLALAEPIMKLLYMKQTAAAISAAPTLAILSVGVVFLASVQTLTGVLQGIERQFIPVINLFIGAVCKAAFTYFLTSIPAVNIKGAAIGTVFAYIVATVLNFRAVIKHTGVRFDWPGTLVKPLISAAIMGAAAFGSYHLLILFIGSGLATVAAIAIGALFYFILLFATRAITDEELAMLPKGEKLSKMYRRFLTKKA
jgi:stage V sporulation protein B